MVVSYCCASPSDSSRSQSAAAASSVVVRVSTPSSAAAVLHALGAQHPALAFALAHARLAVNHAIVPGDTPVGETDEVALIALVDGG